MGEFIIKRLLLCVLILFFVMFIVYALMFSLPTSYVDTMARELATKPGSTKSAQEWLAELNVTYGFDKGIVGGYLTWLGSVVKGEFGDSWYYTLPSCRSSTTSSGSPWPCRSRHLFLRRS